MSTTAFDPTTAADRVFLEEECRDPLVHLLESERVDVGEDFVAAVMAVLPRPAWRRRRLPLRSAALAAAVVLAVVATALLAGSREAGVVGTSVAAIGDLAASALLAGSGLLGASWSFVSLPARAAFGDSPMATVATIGLLLALGFVLQRSLRRRRATVAAASDPGARRR